MRLNPHTDTPDRLRRAESAGGSYDEAIASAPSASFRVVPLDVRGPTP